MKHIFLGANYSLIDLVAACVSTAAVGKMGFFEGFLFAFGISLAGRVVAHLLNEDGKS